MAGVVKTQADTILGMIASWSSIPNTLITWVTPVLLLGLTISIMWQGYKVIRGAGGQDHLSNCAKKLCRSGRGWMERTR